MNVNFEWSKINETITRSSHHFNVKVSIVKPYWQALFSNF